jgi:polysaccharide biosynthesis protein PslH
MPKTVLFIAGHPPWPPISGGRRREYELITRLSATHRIEVCAVDKEAAPGSAWELGCGPVRGVAFGPTEGPAGGSLEMGHHSAPAREWIRGRLRRGGVDLLHCEGFFLRQLAPTPLTVPLVIGTQNVEWQLLSQRRELALATDSRRHPEEVAQARAREEEHLRRADAVVSVTEGDALTLRRAGIDVIVVPDGCDHLPPPGGTQRAVDVAFIANFAYAPNRDAADVLCAQVLPPLRRRRPGVTLRLVGNQADRYLGHLRSPTVEVCSPGSSIADQIADAAVIACPLRIGGGVKVKVLEALRAGAAVVCSTIAAQGLEHHGGALVVEDDAGLFAEAIGDLLDAPERLAAQRAAAARFAATLPRWDEAAAVLASVWRGVMARSVEDDAA